MSETTGREAMQLRKALRGPYSLHRQRVLAELLRSEDAVIASAIEIPGMTEREVQQAVSKLMSLPNVLEVTFPHGASGGAAIRINEERRPIVRDVLGHATLA
jgi:hypothetical protein